MYVCLYIIMCVHTHTHTHTQTHTHTHTHTHICRVLRFYLSKPMCSYVSFKKKKPHLHCGAMQSGAKLKKKISTDTAASLAGWCQVRAESSSSRPHNQ